MAKKLLMGLIGGLLLLSFTPLMAQDFTGWQTSETGSVSPLPTVGVGATVWRFATLLFYLMALLALVFIIYAAIILVTASGDPGKVETARHIIMYALIALAIGVVAYGLVALVYNYLRQGR
jgi:hypothetical protein